MSYKSGLSVLIVAIVLAIYSITSAAPPIPPSGNIPDSMFSETKARDHLNRIANAPHSIGTVEHANVMQYIQTTCIKLGLETSIQNTTGIYSFGGPRIIAGEVSNIMAKIRGTHNSKAVVVAGHYDSQPNAVGAGDDGSACAAMLEAARAIKAGAPLKNDVIFLFTDGEEVGLLGATAYVNDSNLVKQTGLALNFDSRGNSGMNTTFEENPENGWVMREYIKGAAHPNANSFSYEVYKLLPNYTDYTPFKKAGISGLNSGFIEGYANYHSMTDIPSKLDAGSLEHNGSNMVSLVRHFGNLDLAHTRAPDITFFNFVGSLIIWYPNSWNLWFVVLTNIVFIAYLVIGFRKKLITAKGIVSGFFIYLMAIILVLCSSFLLEKLVTLIHPSFANFYNNNHYSSYWYFLVISSFAAIVFTFLYERFSKKISLNSLALGAILMEILLMNVLFNLLTSASYLLMVPLFFLLIGTIIQWKFVKTNREFSLTQALISFLSISPAILILSPIVYFTFVAFGLESTYNASLMLVLLMGMLIPLIIPLTKQFPLRIPMILLIVFVFGFAIASMKSGYTKDEPMQTNIWYRVDADSGKASWYSDFLRTDAFTSTLLTHPEKIKLQSKSGFTSEYLATTANYSDMGGPFAEKISDTIVDGHRKLRLHLGSTRNAISLKIIGEPQTISKALINDQPVDYDAFYNDAKTKDFFIYYYALTSQGIILELQTDSGKSFNFQITDRSLGLDKAPGFNGYTQDVIPGPGSNSNTIQVVKHFSF